MDKYVAIAAPRRNLVTGGKIFNRAGPPRKNVQSPCANLARLRMRELS
jgi:hypothetical protein